MYLNLSLIAICQAWSNKGSRSMRAETDALAGGTARIWLYDYDMQFGCYVNSVEDIPTEEEMIERKRRTLQRDLAALGAGE